MHPTSNRQLRRLLPAGDRYRWACNGSMALRQTKKSLRLFCMNIDCG